jgi:hypothetical protein
MEGIPMIKKGIYVYLILAGLMFAPMTSECFADAASDFAQAQQIEKDGYTFQAKTAYQQIATNYPGSEYALKAQATLVLYIPAEKTTDIYAAIDKLTADFSTHALMPAALYGIAANYESASRYNIATHIYQKILNKYPWQ